MDPRKFMGHLSENYFTGSPLYYSNSPAAGNVYTYNLNDQIHTVQHEFPRKRLSNISYCESIPKLQKTSNDSVCNKNIPQEGPLEFQVTKQSGKKIHACKVCAKRFSSKGNLERHERIIHGGIKDFVCSICKKAFAEKHNLIYHTRTHTGELPFACHICEKKFAVRHNLIYHLRTHTGEKPYTCSECGKKFSHKTSLARHNIIHTGAKPFECNMCKRKFIQKYSLERHIWIHTGEKPFTCDFCDKKFTMKNSLLEHRNKHTGEKPFSCNLCDKAYSRSGSLFSHKKTHKKRTSFKYTVPDENSSSSEPFPSQDVKTKLEIIVNTTTQEVQIYRNTRNIREKIAGTSTIQKVTDSTSFICEFCGKRYPAIYSLLQHKIKHAVVILHDSKNHKEGENECQRVREIQKFAMISENKSAFSGRSQESTTIKTKSLLNQQHREKHVPSTSKEYEEENSVNRNSLKKRRTFTQSDLSVESILPQKSETANKTQLQSFQTKETLYDKHISNVVSSTCSEKFVHNFLDDSAVMNDLGITHGSRDKVPSDSNSVLIENVNDGGDDDDECESIKIESEEEFVDTDSTNFDNGIMVNTNRENEVECQLGQSMNIGPVPGTLCCKKHLLKKHCHDSQGDFQTQSVEYSFPKGINKERKMAALYSYIEYLVVDDWFSS